MMGRFRVAPGHAPAHSSPGIQILDFTQADAYVRRITYLNKLQLPKGGIDLAKNLPGHDNFPHCPYRRNCLRARICTPRCPTCCSKRRRKSMARQPLQRKGEFPPRLSMIIRSAPKATRYYKSGKGFLYRRLPFWMASLVNRVLVSFVPIIVLLIPALRVIPPVFSLRINCTSTVRYRALLAVERDHLTN